MMFINKFVMSSKKAYILHAMQNTSFLLAPLNFTESALFAKLAKIFKPLK